MKIVITPDSLKDSLRSASSDRTRCPDAQWESTG